MTLRIRRIIGVCILLCSALALPAQGPDAATLVQRAVALEKATANHELKFAFRERVLTKELHADGSVRRSVEKVHDVLMIDGTPQRMLLEEGGSAVIGEQMAAQQEFLRRVVGIRRSESSAERRKRVEAFEKKRGPFREAVEEIPRAFAFRFVGEETRAGHACYVIEATPKKGFQPQNRFGRLFAHTYGKIWIDRRTGYWVRVEGDLRETVNLGWIFVQMQKNTRAVAEQRPFPDAGWLMSELWYRTALRVGLFVNYRAEEKASYWGYEAMTPEILARVLKPGYRLPSPTTAK
jgi:hypothetical protein